MSVINQYAPVIITTLCRYEHFRNCIESLLRCTHSENTDVYIGLDYPSNDSHKSGYEKILKYVDTISGFKSFTVFKRDINFGSSKNMRELKIFVLHKYDCFIVSEDDNVFSPNFLDYINKGLELYKDDPQIFAICGFSHPINKTSLEHNIYVSSRYNAWGTGFWKEKYVPYYEKYFNFDYIKSVFYSSKKIKILFKAKRHIFVHRLITSIKLNKIHGDILWNVFLVLENKYCISPTTTKVRNTGSDGTGINCKINDNSTINPQDTDEVFVYDKVMIKESNEILNLIKPFTSGGFAKRTYIIIRYLIFRFFKIDIYK